MICFVTDHRPGEPDILTPHRHQPLRVASLQGATITTIPAPAHGWTHELLQHQATRLATQTRAGADAWLGSQWAGSTEI